MRNRLTSLIFAIGISCCAGVPLEATEPKAPPEWTRKISVLLGKKLGLGTVQAPATQGPWRVILLGSRQLFPPKGFDAFCQANTERKRSELRRKVIARLKAIAAHEQPKILQALGSPEEPRGMWLVNALFVTLTAEQIQQAAELDEVMFIYSRDGLVPARPGNPGPLAEVLKPIERTPFTTEGKRIAWNLRRLGVPKVWEQLKVTGEGVVVAMLDRGVNYRHADLRNNMWINEREVPGNGKDDDGNGYADDLYGYNFGAMKAEVKTEHAHGTWASGIVAGDGTGGRVTGMAPRARIMALTGLGGICTGMMMTEYALTHGADVMNMTFSIGKLADRRGLWRMMCDHATAAGLVMVASAGNFGPQGDRKVAVPVQMRIPEGIPSVIAVGGVDQNTRVTGFSSRGPVEWTGVALYGDHPMPRGLTKPDVCAFPGPRYPLLRAMKTEGYVHPNPQAKGNSYSAPHVAGVAALMLSANPELPAWRVKAILEATATDLPPTGKDPASGAGLVNALAAVKQAISERKDSIANGG